MSHSDHCEHASLSIVVVPKQDSTEPGLSTTHCSSGVSTSSSMANLQPTRSAICGEQTAACATLSLPAQAALPQLTPVPPLPPAAPPTPVATLLSAQDVYRSFQATAESRMRSDYFQLAIMGILAGAYISFAFTFCCAAAGSTGQPIAGALAFPTGLLLIVLCGADLYTGNTCSMFVANIEGKAHVWHHIKHLFSAYFWNLVGCLMIIGFEVGGSVWKGREDWVHSYAHRKIALNWGEVMCRAILANWLVNLALFQGASARDLVGKAIGCWTPITAFVTIGLEHCVANMYIIPMSIYLPPTDAHADSITWRMFISRNLIPATIGNWIGGAIMVGTLNACIYGVRIPRWKDALWAITLGRFIKRLP